MQTYLFVDDSGGGWRRALVGAGRFDHGVTRKQKSFGERRPTQVVL